MLGLTEYSRSSSEKLGQWCVLSKRSKLYSPDLRTSLNENQRVGRPFKRRADLSWQAYRSVSELIRGKEEIKHASVAKLKKIAEKTLKDVLFCENILYQIVNMTLWEDMKCTLCL